MAKQKSFDSIVKLKNIVMSLLILVSVLFIPISPSLAAILPADAASNSSPVAVDSNLADALPSASTPTEPELNPGFKPEPRCAPQCVYNSAIGRCVHRLTGRPC